MEEPQEQEPGAPAWMVTFGDMMTLLLTFFVMMLSFSEIDQVKFKGVMGAIKEALGVQTVDLSMAHPKGPQIEIPRGTLDSILDHFNSIIPNAFPGRTSASDDGDGILLTIPGSVLFNSGEAVLKPATGVFLSEIADLLRDRPDVYLQVEGHTDDIPINTLHFPSNWELSTARSIAVIRYLMEVENLPPQRLAAAGYADTFSIVPNDSPENREKNRRVEFRFIRRDDRVLPEPES